MSATKLWVLAILALIALNLWSVKWLPPVGMDDTLCSSVSHNFVQKGRFASTMVRPIARFDENEVVMGRLHLLGLVVMGFLFEPSMVSDRLWALCMALVSLLVLWQLAKSSLGPSWGVPAVALGMAEPMFFSFSHIPRPEMTMTAIFLLAIFCGMKALEKGGKMWLFLAGLLGMLAIDVHLPGIILAPSIAIALILSGKKSWPIWPNIVWFIGGALVGLCWYLTWHILLNPQLYLLQFEFHSGVNKIVKSSFGSFVAQIPAEYIRYRQWFWGSGARWVRLLEAILILCGIIIQIRSTNIKSRYIGVTTVSLIIIMGLTVNRKAVYYLLPLYPLFVLHALTVVRSMVEMRRIPLIQKRPEIVSKSCQFAGISCLIALFVFYLSQDLVKISKYRQTDYERYISDITAVIPAGPVVAGSPSLWYSLGQRNNLLATVSILWAIDCNGLYGYEKKSVAEIMRRENVRFVVIDPYIRSILNSEKAESARLFLNFIKSECMLVKAFRNDGYIGVGECPKGELTEVFTVMSEDY